MEKQEELMPIQTFTARFAPPPTWVGWVIDAVVKNAWYFRWRDRSPSGTQYVVLPTIKALSRDILAHHFADPTADPILTLKQFKDTYGHFMNEIQLTDLDIMLLLRYMHSQHGVGLADNVKGYGTSYKIIKFPSREGELATITQHDESIVTIRTTCQALSVQVDELQQKSEE